MVLGHEATDSGDGRVLSQPCNFTVRLDTVILECLEGDCLVDTLDFLGAGVDLLLALLTATTETKHQVERRFLLDVVIAQRASVLQLLTGEDKTLLVRWDTFLVLDLRLDIIDGVRWLNVQRDRLTREGLYENLHVRLMWSRRCLQYNSIQYRVNPTVVR